MKAWEAFKDIKLRSEFKNSFLIGMGYTPEKADALMRKYKQYLVRFDEIPDIIFIREIEDLDECWVALEYIFNEKWANNIKESYRMMPDTFKMFYQFLVAKNAAMNGKLFPLTFTSIQTPFPELGAFETPYINGEGKLKVLFNPNITKPIGIAVEAGVPAITIGKNLCKQAYGDLLPSMTDADWERLVKMWIPAKTYKESKTGAKHRRILLEGEGIESKQYMPYDAIAFICKLVGYENAQRANYSFNNDPVVTRSVLRGHEKFFVAVEDGWFINSSGSAQDKLKLIRMYISRFNLKITATLA